MKTFALIIAAGLSLSLGTIHATAQAQGTKPQTPLSRKPAIAAGSARPGGAVILGTTQMPGEFGKLGTTYTIGTRSPLNFTLKSAEYSIAPLSIGQNSWVPKSDEKLLVLHYIVHNPVQSEQRYLWSDLHFTAVDAQNVNHTFIQAVAKEGQQEPLAIVLKPAQQIDVCTAIVMPAEGVVPKLIVEREAGAPVIRYKRV